MGWSLKNVQEWLGRSDIKMTANIYSHLDKLGDMKVSQSVWERGREYYMDNHVRYICVDAGRGRAIVEGERAYEVEFEFADGAF